MNGTLLWVAFLVGDLVLFLAVVAVVSATQRRRAGTVARQAMLALAGVLAITTIASTIWIFGFSHVGPYKLPPTKPQRIEGNR